MAYVITEICLGERYAVCAAVCPTDSIYPGEYQGKLFMVIDPDGCLSCGLCQPECPLGAIVANEADAPEWAFINRELSEEFKRNPPAPERPRDSPPNNPNHQIVNP